MIDAADIGAMDRMHLAAAFLDHRPAEPYPERVRSFAEARDMSPETLRYVLMFAGQMAAWHLAHGR